MPTATSINKPVDWSWHIPIKKFGSFGVWVFSVRRLVRGLFAFLFSACPFSYLCLAPAPFYMALWWDTLFWPGFYSYTKRVEVIWQQLVSGLWLAAWDDSSTTRSLLTAGQGGWLSVSDIR